MAKKDPWFYRERAVAFAGLALTETGETQVKEYADGDMAIDLLVEILNAGKPTLRFFGVQLIPELDLPTPQEAEARVIAQSDRHLADAALPVCAFAVGIRKPEGLYRWTLEPVIEGTRAVLRPVNSGVWQPLDAAGVAHLLAQVAAWYEALQGRTQHRATTGVGAS